MIKNKIGTCGSRDYFNFFFITKIFPHGAGLYEPGTLGPRADRPIPAF